MAAADCAAAAAPEVSKSVAGCVAAVPSPSDVRAVVTLARSARFAVFTNAAPAVVVADVARSNAVLACVVTATIASSRARSSAPEIATAVDDG